MQINRLYKNQIIQSGKFFGILLIPALLIFLTACNKLVEVQPPPSAVTSSNVYSDDATAAAVLTGIYTIINQSTVLDNGINGFSLKAGLSADELTLFSGASNGNSNLVPFYLNALNAGQITDPSAGTSGAVWTQFYQQIYIVNQALERLPSSNTLTPAVRQQLMGEAKFMRAFFYFYLVNLYGGVPLTTSSDYRSNSVLPRATSDQVYQQIIADLKDAQLLLVDGYVASNAMTSTNERLRPNKWAATALLARAFLYDRKYDSAESAATLIINNTALYDTVSLNNAFLKNSKEAIWQFQSVTTGWNTEDARVFILTSAGPNSNNYPVYISPQLLAGFETGDLRRTNWIDSVSANGTTYYYPYKYKSATLNADVTEYTMVLRIGEQYLIRAEARAHQNNISGSQTDLNVIRTRAGLPNTSAGDQDALLTTILHERQAELFTEWGHRWLDLKRTGNVDNIMNAVTPAKGSTWSTNWQ
ncbi:MAG TPA: RagB/SusD family nutrient uptake outer membrane protein, partial [Puia sp.]|nr:RagB/SusD family nutrient uptake outer membrane protein [Puia sp.]